MKRFILAIILVFLSFNTYALRWSGNIGYHNPANTDLGINFMGLASNNFAVEFGFGVPDIFESNNSNSVGSIIETDLNLKYLFNGSFIRPYVQVGKTATILGLIGDEFDFDFSTGGEYFGGGVFILGSSAYMYLSGNRGFDSNSNWFSQLGLGIYF